MQIDQATVLFLLNLFKERISQKQSWRAVQRAMVKTEHQYAFLVTGQKLANWHNPKRRTELEPRAFEAVVCFIQTSEFQDIVPEAKNYIDQSSRVIEAGNTVTELSGIYQTEKTEDILFKALEGMWCDRENLVYLYVHRVKGRNFAIVHLCQKIHDGYRSALGFPISSYVDFFASGFLYFGNDTHSKNIQQYKDKPCRIGQIEKIRNSDDLFKIGVSGKDMRLKLWSKEKRYEANFYASCESSLSDGGYEPSFDKSISVSSFFEFLFKSADSDETYRFSRANYVDDESILWSKAMAKNVAILKNKFDAEKWSVLPNVNR